jgi:hypothetical protein
MYWPLELVDTAHVAGVVEITVTGNFDDALTARRTVVLKLEFAG